jgi:hypothetical protein
LRERRRTKEAAKKNTQQYPFQHDSAFRKSRKTTCVQRVGSRLQVQPSGIERTGGGRLTWSQLPPQDESRDICRLKNEQPSEETNRAFEIDF